MSLVAFVLECAAVAALVGTAVGLLVLGFSLAARPLVRRLGVAFRADLALLLGLLPALAAVGTVLAAAAPSVASVLGFGPDHCAGHEHHLHICFIHSTGLRPALAAVGAVALAAGAFRLWGVLRRALQLEGSARVLDRFARGTASAFPLLLVPGARLCHATGLFRRRVLLSSTLAERLTPAHLRSALAHEEAHLHRRDPLATFVLALGVLFVPPVLSDWLRRQHREAAEEACDAAAANLIGDGAVVAGALVEVAALQREADSGSPLPTTAFGTHALEGRVQALLSLRGNVSSRSHWRFLALAAAVAVGALAFWQAEWLHHATETVLGHIF